MPNQVVTIAPTDMQVSGNSVKISNTDLLRGLVKNQGSALATLGQIAPISAADIDIDHTGKVVVNNAGFANAANTVVTNGRPTTGNNCAC